MDLFKKCSEYTIAREVMDMGLYPFFIPLDDMEGTEATIDGRRVIMIGSNNYLGLTTHPEVRRAASEATLKYGTSCTGSRFLNGTLMLHKELEARLAQFMGKEACLVFSTGYQTNLGTISALVGRDDFVITDREDHASIVDGCRLSYGKMLRFRHSDLADLEHVLDEIPADAGKLVVIDGVFSMGGDIAPLPEIVPLCKKHNARLMVDDAHSIGVLGNGRGTSAHFGVTDQVDIIMGTFSKSFASLGGFIVAANETIHYIQHHARSFIFSASMPPANVAACLAALHIMDTEPERYTRLKEISRKMHAGYRELGFNVGESQTPIIPVIIGDLMLTLRVWKMLLDAGVYANAVVPPAVQPGSTGLRTSYMATHTDEQLDRVLEVFGEVGRKLKIIP